MLALMSDRGSIAERAVGPALGRDSSGGIFHLSESALSGSSLVLGQSGVGRTYFLAALAAHHLREVADGHAGVPLVIVDVEGDLSRLLPSLSAESGLGPVHVVDFSGQSGLDSLPLLTSECFDTAQSCSAALVSVFRDSWDTWGGRLEDILRRLVQCGWTYNVHPETLASERLSLLDLSALASFVDGEPPEMYSRVIERVDPVLRAWMDAFARWSTGVRQEALAPVEGRFAAYSSVDSARRLLDFTGGLPSAFADVAGPPPGVTVVNLALGSVGAVPASLMAAGVLGVVRRWASPDAPVLLGCDQFTKLAGTDWLSLAANGPSEGVRPVLSCEGLASSQEFLGSLPRYCNALCLFRVRREDWDLVSGFMSVSAHSCWPPEFPPRVCILSVEEESLRRTPVELTAFPPPESFGLGSREST